MLLHNPADQITMLKSIIVLAQNNRIFFPPGVNIESFIFSSSSNGSTGSWKFVFSHKRNIYVPTSMIGYYTNAIGAIT